MIKEDKIIVGTREEILDYVRNTLKIQKYDIDGVRRELPPESQNSKETNIENRLTMISGFGLNKMGVIFYLELSDLNIQTENNEPIPKYIMNKIYVAIRG